MLLRAKGISRLVLTGIATSGIVLSTTRKAFDKDYALTILSDAYVDADGEVHPFLLQRIFAKQAEVISIDKWQTRTS